MELSIAQSFELEKLSRDIDSCNDICQIKDIAKKLLHLNHAQEAAKRWLISTTTPVFNTDYSAIIADLQGEDYQSAA